VGGGLSGYSGGTAQASDLLPFYPRSRGTPTTALRVCQESVDGVNIGYDAGIHGGASMAATRQLKVKDGDVLVLVGTMKGAFLLRAPGSRASWELGGPHFPGHAVYAMAYDDRPGRPRLWAAPASMHWGAFLRSSDDF